MSIPAHAGEPAAIAPARVCETCKYWERVPGWGYGKCGRITQGIWIMLSTAPDFGCVLHVRKDEP